VILVFDDLRGEMKKRSEKEVSESQKHHRKWGWQENVYQKVRPSGTNGDVTSIILPKDQPSGF
jgi:hypothetical protein